MTAVSKEYASALFELSLELEKADTVRQAVDIVTAAFKDDPEYIDFLACYAIPVKERTAAVGDAFAGLDKTVLSFIQLLIEQGHIGDFSEIADSFCELMLAYNSMSTATVYSAHPLTDAQKSALLQKLTASFKKQVDINYVIDKTLTGGLLIDMDGTVIDGSIRNRLCQVREVIEK